MNMKLRWFTRKGIFFIPSSVMGWIIFFAGIAYAVYSFIDIDSRSHSVSDTIRPFIIILIVIYTVYSLIASITSRAKDIK